MSLLEFLPWLSWWWAGRYNAKYPFPPPSFFWSWCLFAPATQAKLEQQLYRLLAFWISEEQVSFSWWWTGLFLEDLERHRGWFGFHRPTGESVGPLRAVSFNTMKDSLGWMCIPFIYKTGFTFNPARSLPTLRGFLCEMPRDQHNGPSTSIFLMNEWFKFIMYRKAHRHMPPVNHI